jgi:hypothetical protein
VPAQAVARLSACMRGVSDKKQLYVQIESSEYQLERQAMLQLQKMQQ